jgi:hypothetical protein
MSERVHSFNDYEEATMKKILAFLLAMFVLAGCVTAEPRITPMPVIVSETPVPTATPLLSVAPTAISELSAYAFPASIDSSKQYLFYLHGKIIEEQGLHAVSPDYGEYEYAAILEKLASHGFIVISEQRTKNADGMKYAGRVEGQVTELLKAGVPAKNITIIGASKGGGIALFISYLLKNEEVNFVVMGNCDPDTVASMKQNNMFLHGNVLAIRDSVDELSGSCQELFTFSEGKGLARHDEIVLHVGTGHGILYKPLDEWLIPAVEWARGR